MEESILAADLLPVEHPCRQEFADVPGPRRGDTIGAIVALLVFFRSYGTCHRPFAGFYFYVYKPINVSIPLSIK